MDIKNNIYICEKEPMLSFTAFLRCLCAPPISYFSCILQQTHIHISTYVHSLNVIRVFVTYIHIHTHIYI